MIAGKCPSCRVMAIQEKENWSAVALCALGLHLPRADGLKFERRLPALLGRLHGRYFEGQPY